MAKAIPVFHILCFPGKDNLTEFAYEVLFMGKRLGKQTVALAEAPRLRAWAAVGGKKEGEGPLKDCFDQIAEDPYFGELSWEKAESRMLRICFSLACDKAGLAPSALDYVISGDLLNQCISSAFAMRDTAVP